MSLQLPLARKGRQRTAAHHAPTMVPPSYVIETSSVHHPKTHTYLSSKGHSATNKKLDPNNSVPETHRAKGCNPKPYPRTTGPQIRPSRLPGNLAARTGQRTLTRCHPTATHAPNPASHCASPPSSLSCGSELHLAAATAVTSEVMGWAGPPSPARGGCRRTCAPAA